MTTQPHPSDEESAEVVLRPPTVVGFAIRVLLWLAYLVIAAAVLIPLQGANPYLAIGVALMVAAGLRVQMGHGHSWLAILAIPVSLGLVVAMLYARPMVTVLTADRMAFTVVERTDVTRCTMREVGGDRVILDVPCHREEFVGREEGEVVELAIGGALPYLHDDGTPFEVASLERSYSWLLPLTIASFVGGLLLRVVHVWRTYWRPRRSA